jgi:catalase
VGVHSLLSAVKERELRVPAEVDAELCALVAAGPGLPAPAGTDPAVEPAPSPALSRIGQVWPPDGRMIGIVVDADDPASLDGLHTLRRTITAGGMVPLIIAARGGVLEDGWWRSGRSSPPDRSSSTPCCRPPRRRPRRTRCPAATPRPAPPATAVDPRVVMMVQECYRHAEAIGAWGNAKAALPEAGCGTGDVGVVVGDSPAGVFAQVVELLGGHRAWERFPAVVA